jgi:prevent-host-death family protein
MTTVNVHEAKTHLSQLLDRVAAGEQITIAKAGRPVALLTPIPAGRELGFLGFRLPDSFFEPLDSDELDEWG